ncbi:MAG TPA: hypothetical protein DHD79_12230 [Firmicutes bacterium]|nr:hypothetical protein [Bacillota bacterium]
MLKTARFTTTCTRFTFLLLMLVLSLVMVAGFAVTAKETDQAGNTGTPETGQQAEQTPAPAPTQDPASQPAPTSAPAGTTTTETQLQPKPAPALPPVFVTGHSGGNEVVPIAEQKGLNEALSVSWDGRRAAFAHWQTDTNADGTIDQRDYPAVTYYDVLSRQTTKLFAPADRIRALLWSDPDRILIFRGQAKPAAGDTRGEVFLRVLPTGKETLIANNVIRLEISPDGKQALLWIIGDDTNHDSLFDENDLPTLQHVNLLASQLKPVRLLSGFHIASCSFTADGSGFYYLARRMDTNLDQKIDEQDYLRAYFYDLANWQSKQVGVNIKGSIIHVNPASKGGHIAITEREITPDGLFTEDAVYFESSNGAIASTGILSQGREVQGLKWSPTGERCAVIYRQENLLGESPYGIMIYSAAGKLIRHYEAMQPGGASYPNLLWNPNGSGYVVEKRFEMPDLSQQSEFLAAAGDEAATPTFQPESVCIPKAWTGAGILYVRKTAKAEEAFLGIYARYQFSGTLTAFEPLTQKAGDLTFTFKPAAITARGIYFRVLIANDSEKEIPFDPARLTLTALNGEIVGALAENVLMTDLDARAAVDTLMQSYLIPSGGRYGGFIAFQLPSKRSESTAAPTATPGKENENAGKLKLSILDNQGVELATFEIECQVNLDVF